jgi:hypothetical protein
VPQLIELLFSLMSDIGHEEVVCALDGTRCSRAAPARSCSLALALSRSRARALALALALALARVSLSLALRCANLPGADPHTRRPPLDPHSPRPPRRAPRTALIGRYGDVMAPYAMRVVGTLVEAFHKMFADGDDDEDAVRAPRACARGADERSR